MVGISAPANVVLDSVRDEKAPRWEGCHTVFLASAHSKEFKVFILKDMATGRVCNENIFKQGGKPRAEIGAKVPDAATDSIHSGELRLAG